MVNYVFGCIIKLFVVWDDKGICEELEIESIEIDLVLKE